MVVREAEPPKSVSFCVVVVVVVVVVLVVLFVVVVVVVLVVLFVVVVVVVVSGFLSGSTQTGPSASWTHESPTKLNLLFAKLFRLSALEFKTYQFQRKDRSRGNRILSNTLVALRQFPRIRCLIRTLQGRHSFLSNFSLTAIDRSNQRCKDFRGRVDKPRNWYNFSIIFLLLLRIRRYSRRYILDKNRVWRSYLHLSYPGYRTIS